MIIISMKKIFRYSVRFNLVVWTLTILWILGNTLGTYRMKTNKGVLGPYREPCNVASLAIYTQTN